MKTSVIIAMFNGHKYIKEQLLSIIDQTVQLDEIIIVDDCSKDDSVDIVSIIMNQYPHFNIKLFKNKSNLGVTRTFERAISLCYGDLIFLSDQDDVWMKNKVQVVLEYSNDYCDIDMFYSDGLIVDSDLNIITNISKFYKWNRYSNPIKRLHRAVELENFIPGCSMVIRKKFAISCLPIPSGISNIHDGWFANLSHFELSSLYIPEQLIKYRQHAFNHIGANRSSLTSKLINQLKFNLGVDFVFLKENEYYELMNNYKINQAVKALIITRHNYYKSVKKIVEDDRYTKVHLRFTKALLKSYITNADYKLALKLLIQEIKLLIKYYFLN